MGSPAVGYTVKLLIYRIRQCISRTRILSRTCIFRRIPKIGDKYWGKALIACLRRIPKIDC